MSNFHKEAIYGQWKHSFEEDDDEHIVYRPASFSFQRSRGRKELALLEDGKFVDTAPGPTDIPESLHGNWHLEAERLIVEYGNGQKAQFEIEDVSTDKLVLRKT